jgi:hypothetical protein
MADQRSESPPFSELVRVGTDECPRVADLIGFALGHALEAIDHRRVELHLKDGDCEHCRRWIENAKIHRKEPWPDRDGKGLDPSKIFNSPRPVVPPPTDLTPIPPSSRWQRHVFIDLEQRLSFLEEG